MPSRIDQTLRGFLIPDDRFTLDNMSEDSVYTEAVPRPGSPVGSDARSRLRLQVSGEQSADLTVTVTKAGMPSLGGARFSYRPSDEIDAKNRGWNPPNVVTHWTSAEYDATAVANSTAISATALPSGKLLVIYVRITSLGVCTAYAQTYNPSTDAWSGRVAIASSNPNVAARRLTACTVLPSGRVIAYVGDSDGHSTYYSDDEGATWAVYARNVLVDEPAGSAGGPHRARMYYLPVGEILLTWVSDSGGDPQIDQYVSTDLGTSFSRVGTTWAGHGRDPEVIVTRTGTILAFSVDATSDLPYCYSVSSPYMSLEDATAVQIDELQTLEEITAFCDFDNTIYVIGREVGGDEVFMWRSLDEGVEWTPMDHGLFASGDLLTYPTNLTAIAQGGSGWLVHQWNAFPGDEESSVGLMRLGGHSSLVFAESEQAASDATDDARRISFGPAAKVSTNIAARRQWIPMDIPGDITGWTTAGGGVDVLASGVMTSTCTGVQTRYHICTGGLGTASNAVATALVAVTSGGSTTALRAGYSVRIANGTFDYSTSIRAATTGFVVYDNHAAAVLATVVVDATTHVEIETCLRYLSTGSRLEVRYRRPYETLWTSAYQGVPTNAGAPAASGSFAWGNIDGGPVVSTWRMVQIVAGVDHSTSTVWRASDSGSTTYAGTIGKTLTSLPYPLGDAATDGVTYVRGTDGPGNVAETFSIPVEHDFGVENLFTSVSPSPRKKWKATGTDEVTVEYVPDEELSTTLSTSSHAIYVAGINFPVWTWEGGTADGAAWEILGTADSTVGFTGLSYTREGNVLRVATGSAAAARFIHRGEHVGASINLGSGKVRRVLRHTEGVWADTEGRQVEYILEGIDGTEPTSGTCSIIAHTAVFITHGIVMPYARYRIRIPANQATASGAYEAGLFMAGAFQPAGQEWAWGRGQEYSQNLSSRRSKSGTSKARRLGPVVPSWIVNWTDGIDESPIFGASPDPDYISAGTGYSALAAKGDVGHLLAGALEEVGDWPVVALASVPEANGDFEFTITDPTLFLYSRIESSVSIEEAQGEEGTTSGAVVRVSTIKLGGVV